MGTYTLSNVAAPTHIVLTNIDICLCPSQALAANASATQSLAAVQHMGYEYNEGAQALVTFECTYNEARTMMAAEADRQHVSYNLRRSYKTRDGVIVTFACRQCERCGALR